MKRYIKTSDITYTEDNLRMKEAHVESLYQDWVLLQSMNHPDSKRIKEAKQKFDKALSELEEMEKALGKK